MKKIHLFAIACLLISSPGFAEESKGETQPSALGKKEVTVAMSQVWCVKMDECAGEKKIPIKECEKILSKNFKEGFDSLPKGQVVQVKPESFEQCKKSIQAGTCDALKTAQALPGCEFISLLGSK